jgi:GNAT superfamily N-acetyltransferase
MLFRDAYPKIPSPVRPRTVASLTWFTSQNLSAVRTINASVRDPWSADKLARMLDDPQVNTMVAQRGCLVCGFLSYRIHPTTIDLRHFAVAPDFRNIGVGSQLFRTLIDKLQAHDRPRLTTAISELDPETFGWFVKRGMRGVGVERDGMRPGVDRYRFEYLVADPMGIGRQNCPKGANGVP